MGALFTNRQQLLLEIVGRIMFFCASSFGLADDEDVEWQTDELYPLPVSIHPHYDKVSKMGSLMFVVNTPF